MIQLGFGIWDLAFRLAVWDLSIEQENRGASKRSDEYLMEQYNIVSIILFLITDSLSGFCYSKFRIWRLRFRIYHLRFKTKKPITCSATGFVRKAE